MTKAERQIVAALAASPSMTAAQVAAACDLHRVYATKLIKGLIAQGVIMRQEAVVTYALTTGGDA
jgi:hypothetical protein